MSNNPWIDAFLGGMAGAGPQVVGGDAGIGGVLGAGGVLGGEIAGGAVNAAGGAVGKALSDQAIFWGVLGVCLLVTFLGAYGLVTANTPGQTIVQMAQGAKNVAGKTVKTATAGAELA